MIWRLQLVLSSVVLQSTYAQVQHFFGPPAIGFGVGLLSIRRRFPIARQIVSRRASRSYSHQYHYQATPFGSHGYQSTVSTSSYSTNDHYYASANLRYYQPNVYHYHSTPWHYRWGRSTDLVAKQKREAKLIEIGNLDSIPVEKISDVAANVSIGISDDIWQNDMIFKDQDDCSKMLVCELNRMRRDGEELSESELFIADAFGSGDELDVAKPSLAFDIAAVIGREVGGNRCELNYRRCETGVSQMLSMINAEMEQIENIQKELNQGAIDLNDIENRLDEEDKELESLSYEDLSKTTTTEAYYPGLPLLAG